LGFCLIIARMTWLQFFFKKSPKIQLNKLWILASFCL
jgi:hypothetical protein